MSDLIILDNSDNTQDTINEQIEQKKQKINIYKILNDFVLSFQKMKVSEKAVFFRLTSVMLDSWVTIIKAIWILEKQEKNKFIKSMYNRFLYNLREGRTFSECLEEYPNVFSESEIGMIKSWEKTWKLNDTLLNIAEQTEKMNSVLISLRSALMYPAMIVLVVIWVVIVMMVVIVPRILEIFDDKSSLPLSTRTLIWISDFLLNYGIYLTIVLIVFAVVFMVWKKTDKGKFIVDKSKFYIPRFWLIYKKFLLSRFARSFSSLIASWVPVVESLKIVSWSIGNEVYKQRILLLMEDVKSWIKIWESIDADPLFPEIMVQMIQVWEQTATLDKTIIKVADFYDEQFNWSIAILNKLLEPLIIVFLAITVWFIAISIMQPIIGLADQISATS